MLVLSRQIDESVVIGDHVRLTVEQIVDDCVKLQVQTDLDEPVHVSPTGVALPDGVGCWLQTNSSLLIGSESEVIVVKIAPDRVRLGITTPVNLAIRREP